MDYTSYFLEHRNSMFFLLKHVQIPKLSKFSNFYFFIYDLLSTLSIKKIGVSHDCSLGYYFFVYIFMKPLKKKKKKFSIFIHFLCVFLLFLLFRCAPLTSFQNFFLFLNFMTDSVLIFVFLYISTCCINKIWRDHPYHWYDCCIYAIFITMNMEIGYECA